MTRRTHEKYLSRRGSVVRLPGSVLLWHVVSLCLSSLYLGLACPAPPGPAATGQAGASYGRPGLPELSGQPCQAGALLGNE